MLNIINLMEFRLLSYEEDPDAIVDMHCFAEHLEGSWFNSPLTCKIFAKTVTKTPGSSWVVAYNNIVFAHASLLKLNDDTGLVTGWRTHVDYPFPQMSFKLFEGICDAARKRDYKSIVLFADNDVANQSLKMLSLKPDRTYSYADISQIDKGETLPHKNFYIHPDELDRFPLFPFLGSPLPPAFIMQRALLGCGHRLFSFTNPQTFEITADSNSYIACQDGREWHIFKRGDFKPDPQIIPSILKTAATLTNCPSKALLTNKVLDIIEIQPSNNGEFYDYFHAL